MGRHGRPGRKTWSRRQRTSIRGPLSLMWVAVLAVATGPAACFVVPSSRLRSGSGGGDRGGGSCGFASAAPLPRVVLEIAHHGTRGRGSSSGRDRRGNGGSKTYALHPTIRGGERGGAFNAQGWTQEQQGVVISADASTRNEAGGFRAATMLSQGKRGLSTAAWALDASSTGMDVESTVRDAGSRAKRVLILMSDTGGGHRASSEALSAALHELYGDQIEAEIVDIWTEYGRFPFANAVKTYKFLGRHPRLWKLSYDVARFPLTRRYMETLSNLTCHRSFRRCMEKYQPDLVVSMHPLCHHVPLKVLKRIRKETGKEIPFVTVVTDLGSAHPTWFDPRGDLVYVPSDVLRRRATARGIPPHKLLQFGLPVRDAFWEEPSDKKTMQHRLGLKPGVRTALIVGGGDGVGKLQDIATKVADRLATDHHPGQVVVVCGTNQRIKEELEGYSWPGEGSGVTVKILGFVSNMDEWMTASDLLVTKAGPGTIAEACTRGLPVILSSFLPGQETGNVPYVTENEFGLYRRNPADIAHEVSDLLADRERLQKMGAHARSLGRPRASLDIARSIVTKLMPGAIELPKGSSSSSS